MLRGYIAKFEEMLEEAFVSELVGLGEHAFEVFNEDMAIVNEG